MSDIKKAVIQKKAFNEPKSFVHRIISNKSYVYGTISAIFIIITIFWNLTISNQLTELTPKYSYVADVKSFDNFYDRQTARYTGDTESFSEFSYRVVSSSGDKYKIENLFRVKSLRGDTIFSAKKKLDINSETQKLTLNGKDSGIYLFAPPKVDKKSFYYNHIEFENPVKMKYVSTEELLGLTTYKYESKLNIDQTKNFSFIPDVGKSLGVRESITLTIWIVPKTGYLIKSDSRGTNTFYDLKTKKDLYPRNIFRNTFSQSSVATHVKIAQDRIEKELIIKTIIPFILGAPAVIFMMTVLIMKRPRQSRIVDGLCFVVIYLSSISLIGKFFGSSDLESLELPLPPPRPVGLIIAVFFALVIINMPRLQKNRRLKLATLIALLILGSILTFGLFSYFLKTITGISNFQDNHALNRYFAYLRIDAFICMSLIIIALIVRLVVNNKSKLQQLAELLVFVSMLIAIYDLVAFSFGQKNLVGTINYNATFFSALAITLLSSALLLSFINKSSSLMFKNFGTSLLTAIILLIVLLLMLGSIWQFSQTIYRQDEKSNFQNKTSEVQDKIKSRLTNYANALQGIKGLFDASNAVDKDEFNKYVESLNLKENFPGVQGVGYAKINKGETESNFSVPVTFIEPLNDRNSRAVGFDMASEPTRRSAIVQAIDTGLPALTGRATLVQETNKDMQWGALIYIPIYEKGASIASVEQRKQAISGFAYAPLRMNDFIESVAGSDLDILDVSIYNTNSVNSISSSNIIYGKNSFNKTKFYDDLPLFFGGQTWQVTYRTNQSYLVGERVQVPTVILYLGVFSCFIFSLAAYALSSSRQRSVNYADKVTKELKVQRNRAVEDQQKDEAILSGVAEGLIVYDADGTVRRINDSALTMLKFSPEDVIGKKFFEAFDKYTLKNQRVMPDERPIAIVLNKGEVYSNKLFYKCKDSSLLPVRVTASPTIIDGKVTGVVEIISDITIETQVDKNKTEFVSLAAHQLKTPVGALIWDTEILMDGTYGEVNDEQSEVLGHMLRMNQRMNELVNGFLNVSRIESGLYEVDPRQVLFSDVVEDILEEMNVRINEKAHEVTKHFPDGLPSVDVDRNLLRIVLHNLISNAIKYTPNNGHIDIQIKTDNSTITVDVSNNGIEIPREDKAKIFSKLQRASNAQEMDPDGNGLGLYMVKQIVESTGGKVWFDSNELLTTFHVQYPLSGMKARKGKSKLTG
ncbi:MAG: porin PorA family protein [Acidimicrobiia bacterium]